MILECPSCHAQFNVPDGAVTAAGRTVKCSSCQNQWHAMPPAPKPVAAAFEASEPPAILVDTSFLEELARATDAPDESVAAQVEPASVETVEAPAQAQAQPAPGVSKTVKQPFVFPFPMWPFRLAAPSLVICWLALAMLAYFPSWIDGPIVGGIYKALGVVPTDGVILADIAMQRQQEGQRTRFLISGNIVNQEAAPRTVPAVRIQMLSNENEVVWAREYAVDKTLKPGEIYPFRITNAETSFANNVSQLVVDVGHPLQMMFR